jgi:hypothetical protein
VCVRALAVRVRAPTPARPHVHAAQSGHNVHEHCSTPQPPLYHDILLAAGRALLIGRDGGTRAAVALEMGYGEAPLISSSIKTADSGLSDWPRVFPSQGSTCARMCALGVSSSRWRGARARRRRGTRPT